MGSHIYFIHMEYINIKYTLVLLTKCISHSSCFYPENENETMFKHISFNPL